MIDANMIREAGVKTFEYAAPLILVGTTVAVWHVYGWPIAGIVTAGYLVAASLAWRAAWVNYRKRDRP